MKFSNVSRRRPHGLTLIELVVVVAVLAILAGFIVPRLGFVRNLASAAGSATIIADSATQAVFYNTAVGHYPEGEDALLDNGNALYANLNPKLTAILTPLNLANDTGAGKSLVSQIDPLATSFVLYEGTAGGSTASTPNSDFTYPETVTKNSGYVAQVTVPTALNSASYPVYQAAYGSAALNNTTGAPLDGTYLVALGYGSNSQINGKTGLEAPVLFDKVQGEYTRPILLLKVFGNNSTTPGVPVGTSAATSISIGFDATTANNQLTNYAINQNR